MPALTALSEAARALAFQRFAVLRPVLEEGSSQTQVANLHGLPLRTVQRWLHQYRQHGVAGLARQGRSDRGKRRGLPTELVHLIEGLALQKPRRSAAAIHRQVTNPSSAFLSTCSKHSIFRREVQATGG